MLLHWDPPNDNVRVTKYAIRVVTQNVTEIVTAERTLASTLLFYDINYTISVEAISNACHGPPSMTSSFIQGGVIMYSSCTLALRYTDAYSPINK